MPSWIQLLVKIYLTCDANFFFLFPCLFLQLSEDILDRSWCYRTLTHCFRAIWQQTSTKLSGFFFFFFSSSFGLYLTNLQGLTIPLTTFIIPCSKLSKCFTCHFKLNSHSWVSVSGLDCILQSIEINSIHRISLIFMISDVLAKVCSFTDATILKRTFYLQIGPQLAPPPAIEISFKILCEFMIHQLGILNWGKKMYTFFLM